MGGRVTLSLRGLVVAESRECSAGRTSARRRKRLRNGLHRLPGGARRRAGRRAAKPWLRPPCRCHSALTESRCAARHIDGVRYTPEDLSAATWAGYKRFTDADRRRLHLRPPIRPFRRAEEVPAGTVSLTGILSTTPAAGDGRYILKLRDENDCALLACWRCRSC